MSDALTAHLAVCDELHQLALEENRFLKQHQRVPSPSLLERHQTLIGRLETSLASLRGADASQVPSDPGQRATRAAVVSQARDRLLQILHLLRENEQLVLRHSLGPSRAAAPVPVAPPPAARLQKLYEQHSG